MSRRHRSAAVWTTAETAWFLLEVLAAAARADSGPPAGVPPCTVTAAREFSVSDAGEVVRLPRRQAPWLLRRRHAHDVCCALFGMSEAGLAVLLRQGGCAAVALLEDAIRAAAAYCVAPENDRVLRQHPPLQILHAEVTRRVTPCRPATRAG